MFIALFIVLKIWKQPKCFSVGAWKKKWRPILTMEYYSVPKKMSYENMKRHRGNTNAYYESRKRPMKKTLYCMIPTI